MGLLSACGSSFESSTTDPATDSAPPGQDCCGPAEAGIGSKDAPAPGHEAGKPKTDSGGDADPEPDSGCASCDSGTTADVGLPPVEAGGGDVTSPTDAGSPIETGSDVHDAASPDSPTLLDSAPIIEAGPESGPADSSGGDTGITETGAYDGPVIVDPTTPCSASSVTGGIALGEQVFEDGGPVGPYETYDFVDGSWVFNPDAEPPPGSIFLSYYDYSYGTATTSGYAYGVSGACVDPIALCGMTNSAEIYEGIGVNLNQAIGEGPATSPANPVALTGTGITVAITASAAASFQIIVNNGGVDYCSPSEASGALVSVPWSKFKSCAGGVSLGTSPPTSATHIEFVTLDPGLSFCVTSLGPAT